MARENENQNIFSKAIFSSVLVVIALIAIYATPKISDLGIIIGTLFIICLQWAPLFSNGPMKKVLSVLAVVVALGSALLGLCYSSVDVGHTGFLVTFGRVSDQTYGEGD